MPNTPVIYIIDPDIHSNSAVVRLINEVSEIKAHPFDMEFTGGHPYLKSDDTVWRVGTLFGRVVGDEVYLFLLAKFGNQSLTACLYAIAKSSKDFPISMLNLIRDYVLMIDLKSINKPRKIGYIDQTWDYTKYARDEIKQLRNMVPSANLIIAVQTENPHQLTQSIIDEIRTALEIDQTVKVMPHQFDRNGILDILINLVVSSSSEKTRKLAEKLSELKQT